MDKLIKVGLIGFGAGGQTFHAPVLTTVHGLQLAKIRAVKPEQVNPARVKYSQAEIVQTSAEIFEDENIDLVIITTPNTSHHSLALQALQADKHVVVDKPFTTNTKDADELIEEATKRNLILSVYHSRRFDSDFYTVQKIIKNNLLGGLVEMESRYDRFRNYLKPNAWREEDAPGSGILYDLGSHLIDQAQTLFGLPDTVSADLGIQRKGGKAIDNFEIILHFPGLKVTLKAGMLVREPLPRFILLGNDGSFVKYGLDVQEEALKAGFTSLTKNSWGIEPADIWGTLNTEIDGQHFIGKIESEKGDYSRFYNNIYNAIIGKEELIVTPVQARNNVRIIELAMQSQKEKRTIDFTF
ncbi:oxidoreductase [Ginsengibacter hankyongi]|uniref:Oxidoreductase n=1 Tax=Ginsengibacter hankyongi TaxID=2607284 RepID=A0A5J5IFW4_9BACT|nr:Gfo/Idh/MocA family oxidoreductase [Ginsengibacter hankyongi]KAA9035865.1 oxidoreductase [Ginsengibacter hankyongi]